MTMQIDSRQTIGGVSLLQVRRFFRRVVSHHRGSFDKAGLFSYLQLSEHQADQLLEGLTNQGFISIESPKNNSQYQLTDLARDLVRSSAREENIAGHSP